MTMSLNVIFLFVLMIFSITWFSYSTYELIVDFTSNAEIITFNKGSMYMPGVGIGGFFLLIGLVQKGLFDKALSKKFESLLIRGTVVGLVIMFTLPHISHFYLEKKIIDKDYINCDEMSYQWLMYKKFVYTQNADLCIKLIQAQQTG